MFERQDNRAFLDATRRCPRCGSTLLTNGAVLWCSFVGGRAGDSVIPACRFGLDEPVKKEDVPPRSE